MAERKKGGEDKERQKKFREVSDFIIKEGGGNSVGLAGEFRVISELLSRGFYVFPPKKDDGVDIVAKKENSVFNIQVKTSSWLKTERYWFDIRIKSFEKHYDKNTYYIFVAKDENGELKFFILPCKKIQELYDKELIRESRQKYKISLKCLDGKFYFAWSEKRIKEQEKDADVTYYLDRWDLLEKQIKYP